MPPSRVFVTSVVAFASLLACACATVSITYRDPRIFPARTPDAVTCALRTSAVDRTLSSHPFGSAPAAKR